MEQLIISMIQQALVAVLYLSAPVVVSALLTGLCVSIFQATTQIQEQTLSYVPKLIVVCFVIIVFGRWMLSLLVLFTSICFGKIPDSTGW